MRTWLKWERKFALRSKRIEHCEAHRYSYRREKLYRYLERERQENIKRNQKWSSDYIHDELLTNTFWNLGCYSICTLIKLLSFQLNWPINISSHQNAHQDFVRPRTWPTATSCILTERPKCPTLLPLITLQLISRSRDCTHSIEGDIMHVWQSVSCRSCAIPKLCPSSCATTKAVSKSVLRSESCKNRGTLEIVRQRLSGLRKKSLKKTCLSFDNAVIEMNRTERDSVHQMLLFATNSWQKASVKLHNLYILMAWRDGQSQSSSPNSPAKPPSHSHPPWRHDPSSPECDLQTTGAWSITSVTICRDNKT